MDRKVLDDLLSPPFDRELKHYLVLAQVQHARQGFAQRKLYPHLDRVRQLLAGLRGLAEACDRLDATMPRTITAIDTQHMRLSYARTTVKPSGLEVIDDLLATAIPLFAHLKDDGAGLRHDLMKGIRFEPIGLLPLYADEGYMMLRQGNDARVYAYTLLPVHTEEPEARHLNLTTHYVSTWTLGLARSYGTIKQELVRAFSLPNPATFAFEAIAPLPPVETFLPLAKQLVYDVVVRGRA
jgi:hypothetical protein